MRRFVNRFMAERASTRVGFILQILCRVLYSLFSLLWTPLLLASMGKGLNGLFLNFQKMASLGIVGDLGMGGLINIQTSRLLGQGKEPELRSFLAATRAAYVAIAGLVAVVFLAISPSLFRALHFSGEPTVGSLGLLSVVGASAIMLVVLNSYINNLNMGCGNVVWPPVPTLIVMQLAALVHWLLALDRAPLWLQYTPYVVAAVLVHAFGWFYVRLSHPALAVVRPLRFSRPQLVELGMNSFWVYLYTIGSGIYTSTDAFLITAGFGPERVPAYLYNYRLCELASFVIFSAGQTSMPKLTRWIASADQRQRGIEEALRLNKFQTFLGCCGAYVYLIVNDWFIGLWLGKGFHAPLSWQTAFATTLAVNASGYMGSDLVARCCERGIRFGGVTGLGCSVLNLVLAFAAMRAGSIPGIAFALSAVMSVQNLLLGCFSSRELKISWWRLSLRNWVLAILFVGIGLLARMCFLPPSRFGIAWLIPVSPLVFLLAAWLAGIRIEDLKQEARILRSIIVKAF